MQKTSALYNSILATSNNWYETKLVIEGVGTFYELELFSMRTAIEMFSKVPTIGKAVSAEIEISMLNPTTAIPTMAVLRPYIRICGMARKSSEVEIEDETLIPEDASYANETITLGPESSATVSGETLSFPVDSEEYGESEWLPQGVFYVDTREVTDKQNGLDVLTIHGFDAMLKTEQEYSSNSAVGDDYDTKYVAAIAQAIGVDVDDRTWEIMGVGTVIPFPAGYTMREILGFIASAYVGCFIITDEGKLRLVSLNGLPAETNLLIDDIGDVLVFGEDAILLSA